MKRTLFIIGSLFFTACLVLPQMVLADTDGNATSGVYANVDANIGVQPGTAQVNAGSIQTGELTSLITFRIDANTESVKFQALASDLWKGDIVHNGGDDTVTPIPLNLSAGVVFEADNASTVDNVSNTVDFLSTSGLLVDGYPAQETGMVAFESGQNGHFSQDVVLTFAWNQDDPEKPMGQYSGAVKLVAMTVLPFD